MNIPDEAIEAAERGLKECLESQGIKLFTKWKDEARAALEAAMPRIRREIADLELSREVVNRINREGGSSDWAAGYDAAIIDVMRLLGEKI